MSESRITYLLRPNRYMERSILSHMWKHARTFMFSNFLSDPHSAHPYMESRLKTTQHLFKWCCRLNDVFLVIYWQRILGNLKFIYKVRVKNLGSIPFSQFQFHSIPFGQFHIKFINSIPNVSIPLFFPDSFFPTTFCAHGRLNGPNDLQR